MPDTINITVNETIDNVVISPAITTDVIDINTYSTTETINIDVTPEVTIVNINTVTGGGGTQTLAQTLDLGNNTGGENILVNNADAIELENTSLLKKGSYNFGGNGGISRICSNNYEDMWQNGYRHVFDQSGFIRNSTNCFNVIPDSSFDVTLRFKVGSIWTLDDGTNYICTDATEGDAVWEIYTNGLVPYTAATQDLNLGINNLKTNKVFLFDEANDNYASIHYADGDFHIEDADGHKLLVIEDGFMQLHLSDTIQSNLFTTLLTATRDHYLPNNSGTIALTTDITGTNSGTNTGDETATTIKSKLGISTLSGSNTGDQDLSALALKSMGAYSFRVNNTNAVANATETNFRQIGKTAYTGTPTWTGTTAPSGAANHSYNWIQIGNLVQGNLTLVYATVGTLNTAVSIPLPSNLPTPIKPDGLIGALNVLYRIIGRFTSSETTLSTAGADVVIRSNAANNGFDFYVAGTAVGAKVVYISFQYFTA